MVHAKSFCKGRNVQKVDIHQRPFMYFNLIIKFNQGSHPLLQLDFSGTDQHWSLILDYK